MKESFYYWLGQFRLEDSAIGGLANDVYEDRTFPKRSTYNVIRRYLRNYEDRDENAFKGKANDKCLKIFDEAYKKYRKYRTACYTRQWYVKNKARQSETSKRWHVENKVKMTQYYARPEVRIIRRLEVIRRCVRRWYSKPENKDKHKKYYIKNRVRILEARKQRYAKNKSILMGETVE